MTGDGAGRDGPDDARQGGSSSGRGSSWRGPRVEHRPAPAPPPGAFGDSWTGRAELEELPAQPVLPRGSPRLGVGGTLAVVAIVGLVAAGFGLLGGRPEAPDATPRVRPSQAAFVPSQVVEPVPSPLVTPWTECGGPFAGPVDVSLQVGGRPAPGAVEIVSLSYHAQSPEPSTAAAVTSGAQRTAPGPPQTGPEAPGLPLVSPRRVDVPIDVITEIWIGGSRCALAWNIDLVGGPTIASVPNPEADPGYAAQNRFQLEFDPFVGGEHDLRAVLLFPSFVARVTWPIRILPIERPRTSLRVGDVDVEPAPGCDVAITFGPERSVPLNPCDDDIGEPLLDAVPVRSGTAISFELVDWFLDSGVVTCGRMSGNSFVAEPRPGCSYELEDPGTFTFEAPPQNGRWTLAISACGSRAASQGPATNRLCGTWYADIVVTGV